MDAYTNDTHLLADIPAPPGVTVWPKMTGRLLSRKGVHFELGNYTCPHIIRKGRGMVRAEGKEAEVGPGDMFCIMNSGQIEYFDLKGAEWDYLWLHLDGPGADDFVRAWGFTPEKPWLTPEEPGMVLDGFDHLHRLAAEPTRPAANELASRLFALAAAVCKNEPPQTSRSRQLIDRAQAVIEAQLHTAININELAAILQVDRTTLFHAFRKECGCSPIEYLREKRIERACLMLIEGERKLDDIARICGFSNPKYFMKTFRQLRGTTPNKFRHAGIVTP